MKIAIISINIGDYDIFWSDFYQTAEKNFFPESNKEYFVFTDKIHNESFRKKNVIVLKQEDLGWPLNTMKRFNMFLTIKDDLLKFDYVFFANANTIFVNEIDKRILNENKEIIVVEHPGFHMKDKMNKPFERRKDSRAYVPIEKGLYYVQGAFYGGKSKSFVKMIEILNKNTENDLKEGIIAIWHDESFLNQYVSENINIVQILGWQYLYFEEYYLPYKKMIVLRNKKNYLPKQNARFKNQSKIKAVFFVRLRNIKWRLLVWLGKYHKYDHFDVDGNYIDNDITVKPLITEKYK